MNQVKSLSESEEFKHNLDIMNNTFGIFRKILNFNNEVINAYRQLEKEGIIIDDLEYQVVNRLNYLTLKLLCVEDDEDYYQISGVIETSTILVNRGYQDKDVDSISLGVYMVSEILEDLKVFEKEDNFKIF